MPDPAVAARFAELYDCALEHAKREAPREACGLLSQNDAGVVIYHPCRNIAPEGSARDRFVIHPEDWALVEDGGREVIAVVHSHPDADAHPSDADRWMCHRSGLPWFIVALPSGVWTVTWPAPLPLVGRQFFHGTVDCYTAIQDYYAQKVQIALPDFEREDDWWETPGRNLYRDNFEAAGFVDLGRPVGRPDGFTQVKLHDVLLMRVGARVENHGAVFVGKHHGVDSILHHPYGGISQHTAWSRDWIERTTAVLRHRSLL